MVRCRILDKIITYPYAVKNNEKDIALKPCIGLDTETYNGKVTLFADSNGRYLLVKNLDMLLNFLFIGNPYKHSFNFFFNLEYDTNAILKLLPDDNIRDIIRMNFTYYVSHDQKNKKCYQYRFNIIPKKSLRISKQYLSEDGTVTDSKSIEFFDIYQFYQIGSLTKTYKKVFGKEYNKLVDASIRQFKLTEITETDIKYCIEDAQACKELAENFVNLTFKIVPIKRFLSPASLAKGLMRKNLTMPYRFKKNLLQEYALLAYNGGRFETFRRGFFPDNEPLYMADIRSAYPDAMSKEYGFNGYLVYEKKYIKEALHGFYKCNVNIDADIISPLRFMQKNKLFYPNGKLKEIYLTKRELELCMRYDIEFEILDAVQLIGEKTYPFSYIPDLYKLRMQYKKEKNPLQLPLKLALNSLYGITIQVTKNFIQDTEWEDIEELDIANDFIDGPDGKMHILRAQYKAGSFFNPVYAAEITANVRCKIYEDSISNEKDIIMYATDSITSTKKLKLDYSDNLGDYELQDNLYGLILGSGIYTLIHKCDSTIIKNGLRGFDKGKNLIDIAKESGKSHIHKFIKQAPVKLKEARTRLEDLNVFEDKGRELAPNFDHKRIWERDFNTFEDALTSNMGSKPLFIETG